jgi:hypothetical protein
LLAGLFFWWTIDAGYWDGLYFMPFVNLDQNIQIAVAVAAVIVLVFLYGKLKNIAGKSVLNGIEHDETLAEDRPHLLAGFRHNLKAWWQLGLSSCPRGWGRRRERQLARVIADTDAFVQELNDGHANPAGSVARR